MKKIADHIRAEWYKYLLEILVLIVGIYGAFSLENWNAQKQNRAKEQILLQELNREFKANSDQLEIIVTAHTISLEASEKIIAEFPIDLQEVNLDSMGRHVWDVYSTYSFNPSQGTINSLISTSSFDLISDEKLRSLIVSWKDIFEDYSEDENRANKDAVENMAPFLNNHFPFNMNLKDTRFDPKILTTLIFENQIQQRNALLIGILKNGEDELKKLTYHMDQIIELTE